MPHPQKSSRRSRIGRSAARRRRALGLTLGLSVVVLVGGSLAGASGPSLQDRIDGAQSDADQLSAKVDAKSNQISDAESRARAAGARAMELGAELQQAQARSEQLAGQLEEAEKQLAGVRARYRRAVGVLSQRLVDIYKGSEPDALSVILGANGFDDLETRTEYLDALHDADTHVADRVEALRDEVHGRYADIAKIKSEIDAEAARLRDSRAQFTAAQDAAEQEAGTLADARAGVQSDLDEAQGQVADLEQQQSSSGSGGSNFAGGPYSIPTYIVMCESGGDYGIVNPSSGAGGAYQIIPSTWAAYGGHGAPQDAPKAEQDRIAALIWADAGPGAWSCA